MECTSNHELVANIKYATWEVDPHNIANIHKIDINLVYKSNYKI